MFIVTFDFSRSQHYIKDNSEIKPVRKSRTNNLKEYSKKYDNYHKNYYD